MKLWFGSGVVVLGFFILLGCTTTSIDKQAFDRSEVESIGIVIGSANRAHLYNVGGKFVSSPVYSSLPATLDKELNDRVLQTLISRLKEKGYKVVHIKTVPIEWDLYGNLSDSQESHDKLFNKYKVSNSWTNVDAVLFVECLLEPKGPLGTMANVDSLTSANFEVKYAMAKLFLYEMRTGQRLYYATNIKGYEQVFSHVAPSTALTEILNLSDIPLLAKGKRLDR